jgi:hypothetical protein
MRARTVSQLRRSSPSINVERPAGLDAHKDVIVAEVHLPDGLADQGRFLVTTSGLVVLRDWLLARGSPGLRRQQLDAVRSGKFRDSGWIRPGRLRQYESFGWLPHVGDECVETGRAKDQQSAALAELGHSEAVRHASG